MARRLRPLLILTALVFSALPHLARAQSAQPELVDGVAAVINNEVITFSQVREVVGARERALRTSYRGEELISKIKEARLAALKDLIDRQLILQEFKKQGYKIPDRVIDEQVQSIIKEEFGGDRNTFIKTLEAQGYSLSKFRAVETEKIQVQAMRQKHVRSDVVIPPQRIEEFYATNKEKFATPEQVKLRMLVLRGSTNDAGTSQKSVAEEIRQKIVGGSTFDRMAQMYSEDPTKENGGDWGWIDRKTLTPELTEAAFKLKAGQVSQVIESNGNCYLLYVEARKNATYKPLSEVRTDIEKQLLQQERQRAQERWLDSLRQKAYIKMF